jgi:hypothetical protein
MAEPKGALKSKFEALQVEYRAFYEIRNNPKEGIEYEDWKKLSDADRKVWALKLKAQADKVGEGIKGLEELKAYRPYHELRAYFGEDRRELEKLIGRYGFRFG